MSTPGDGSSPADSGRDASQSPTHKRNAQTPAAPDDPRQPPGDPSELPAVAAQLARDGPQPASNLTRSVTQADRRAGVQAFEPLGSRGKSGATRAERVFHLPEHDRATIFETWYELNEATLAEHPRSALSLQQEISRRYPSYRELSHEALGPFEPTSNSGEDTERRTTCPFCEEPVSLLPSHLPCPEK